jgi:hypothetical protein
MNILINLASKGRPRLLCEVLDRTFDYLSGQHRAWVFLKIDEDDHATREYERFRKLCVDRRDSLVQCYLDGPQTKISATNAGIKMNMPWEVLVNLADDMVPVTRGFDDVIARRMNEAFPHLDGALWFPDGLQSKICTMSVLGRKYYDRFGFVYPPQFKSLYADDWHTQMAQHLGRLARFPDELVSHWYTQWTGTDATHFENMKPDVIEHDRRVFEDMKRKGFPGVWKFD